MAPERPDLDAAAVPHAAIVLRVAAPASAAGQMVPLRRKPLYIGRDRQANLRADHPAMSPLHCILLRRGDRAFVRDLASTTGTFVNGEPTRGEVELRHGDRLTAGVLAFDVQVEGGSPLESIRAAPDSTEAIVLEQAQEPPIADGKRVASDDPGRICPECGMTGEWDPPARFIGDRAVMAFRCPGGHVWNIYLD